MTVTSLEAYYPGDDLGSATILDHSGNGRHLSFVTGKLSSSNGAIAFDGSSSARAQEQAATPDDFLFFADAFTFAANVKVDAGTGIASIYMAADNGLRILQASSTLSARVSIDGASEVNVNIPYSTGAEVFLIVTYDGNTITISDGTNTDTDTLAGPLNIPSTPRFRLGFQDPTYMTGTLRDVMLWSRALTSTEQDDLRAGSRPPRLQKGAVDVCLAIGQSNMSGEAADVSRLSEQTKSFLNNSQVFYDSKHKLLDGVSRTRDGLRNDGGHSPGVALAASLGPGHAVYQHGISGTFIDSWQIGGASYAAMKTGLDGFMSELRLIGYMPKLATVVWVHGESASGNDQDAAAYAAELQTLITSYRRELGDTPWLITRLPEAFSGHPAYPSLSITQQSQEMVTQTTPRVEAVNTDDLVALEAGETNHWSASSAIAVGRALAEKLLQNYVNAETEISHIEKKLNTNRKQWLADF